MTEVYGWRGRIGLILPLDNVVMEPELNALALPGVSFHGLRLTVSTADAMRSQAIETAGAMVELGLDAVAYACAETSFNGGSGVRKTLSQLIENECSLPVVTATNAMLAAAKQLGLERIAVVTPYGQESGTAFEQTLAESGLTVVSALHRDFRLESDDPREWYVTNRQPATEVYAMARKADTKGAEAVVIAATNLSTFGIIEQLETDLGKPVLTSNQCILWWCLRELGLSTKRIPLGRIMTTDVDETAEELVPAGRP